MWPRGVASRTYVRSLTEFCHILAIALLLAGILAGPAEGIVVPNSVMAKEVNPE